MCFYKKDYNTKLNKKQRTDNRALWNSTTCQKNTLNQAVNGIISAVNLDSIT